MTGLCQFSNWRVGLARLVWREDFWREDHAAQIVEFAVALPLLLVFVVGIFDFSGAFTLKQKLTNAARDSARAAAADTANDLTAPKGALPASVSHSFEVVRNYLAANNINDCGIRLSGAPTLLTWTFTPASPCPVGVQKLIINRGYYFPQTGATLPSASCTPQPPSAGAAIVATCVSIQYAYSWRFGRVSSLLGTTAALPPTITVVAVSMNEN